jgi:hypothetical protein
MAEPLDTPPASDPPATSPTPEEISARLEALLKRTHALRQAQDAVPEPGGPLPWPPGDGELEAFEMMEVPGRRTPAAREARPLPTPAAPVEQPSTETADFGRPDWSTLRLRDPEEAPPRTPTWMWLLVGALLVALGLETAYLLRLAPTAPAAADPMPVSTLRLDGDPRLQVRIDGGAPQSLPLEQTIEAGSIARLTVQVSDAAAARPAAGPASAPSAAPTATSPTPAAEAPTARATTAITGAVRIESSPPGALIIMEGRERGVTPLTIDGLRPGRHDVMVSTPATGRLTLKVDIVAGQTARLDATPR